MLFENDITQLFEGNFTVPNNFQITSPPYDPQQDNIKNLYQAPFPQPNINRQTEVLCEKLRSYSAIVLTMQMHRGLCEV